MVAIVLSAGGLFPLRHLIHSLRCDLPAAFVVAQHAREMSFLSEILAKDTEMTVSLAESGMPLQSGRIYVCPPARHVIVNPDSTLTVSTRQRLRHVWPNGDWLFESAAASFGARTFAVVLSGCLQDGARGSVSVRKAGGTVLAQTPATCERRDMPLAAIATGCVDHVLSAGEIGSLLNLSLAAANTTEWSAVRDRPFGLVPSWAYTN